MKTITLTDEAYLRLKDWKESEKDSFSTVVMRVVPQRGTLSDMLSSLQQLSPLTEEQAQMMEASIEWGNDWKNHRDPWTNQSGE